MAVYDGTNAKLFIFICNDDIFLSVVFNYPTPFAFQKRDEFVQVMFVWSKYFIHTQIEIMYRSAAFQNLSLLICFNSVIHVVQ